MVHKLPIFIRIIAAILVVTFLAQDIVWAYPDAIDKNLAVPGLDKPVVVNRMKAVLDNLEKRRQAPADDQALPDDGAKAIPADRPRPQLAPKYIFVGIALGTLVPAITLCAKYGLITGVFTAFVVSIAVFLPGWRIHELGHKIAKRLDKTDIQILRAGPMLSAALFVVSLAVFILVCTGVLSETCIFSIPLSVIASSASLNYCVHTFFADDYALFARTAAKPTLKDKKSREWSDKFRKLDFRGNGPIKASGLWSDYKDWKAKGKITPPEEIEEYIRIKTKWIWLLEKYYSAAKIDAAGLLGEHKKFMSDRKHFLALANDESVKSSIAEVEKIAGKGERIRHVKVAQGPARNVTWELAIGVCICTIGVVYLLSFMVASILPINWVTLSIAIIVQMAFSLIQKRTLKGLTVRVAIWVALYFILPAPWFELSLGIVTIAKAVYLCNFRSKFLKDTTPPPGMIGFIWKHIIPSLEKRGWSGRQIAFWCGFAEETAIGAILGIIYYLTGADPYKEIIWAASAAAFIFFFITHLKGVYRFNEGDLSPPAKPTKDDLADIGLLGLNLRFIYLFLLASISPYSAILAILIALITASIWHAVYNGFIAPLCDSAVGMAGKGKSSPAVRKSFPSKAEREEWRKIALDVLRAAGILKKRENKITDINKFLIIDCKSLISRKEFHAIYQEYNKAYKAGLIELRNHAAIHHYILKDLNLVTRAVWEEYVGMPVSSRYMRADAIRNGLGNTKSLREEFNMLLARAKKALKAGDPAGFAESFEEMRELIKEDHDGKIPPKSRARLEELDAASTELIHQQGAEGAARRAEIERDLISLNGRVKILEKRVKFYRPTSPMLTADAPQLSEELDRMEKSLQAAQEKIDKFDIRDILGVDNTKLLIAIAANIKKTRAKLPKPKGGKRLYEAGTAAILAAVAGMAFLATLTDLQLLLVVLSAVFVLVVYLRLKYNKVMTAEEIGLSRNDVNRSLVLWGSDFIRRHPHLDTEHIMDALVGEIYRRIGILYSKKAWHESERRFYRKMHKWGLYYYLSFVDYYEMCYGLNQRIGELEESAVYLEEKLKVKTGEYKKILLEVYRKLGLESFASGRYEQALAEFGIGRDLKSDDPQIHCSIGAVYLKLGRIGEALPEFEEARKLAPMNATFYFYLGITHDSLGEPSKAIDELKKATELDPQYFLAYHNIGVIRYGLGETAEAAKNFRAAIRLNPGFRSSFGGLIACLSDLAKAGDKDALRELSLISAHADPNIRKTAENASPERPVSSEAKTFTPNFSIYRGALGRYPIISILSIPITGWCMFNLIAYTVSYSLTFGVILIFLTPLVVIFVARMDFWLRTVAILAIDLYSHLALLRGQRDKTMLENLFDREERARDINKKKHMQANVDEIFMIWTYLLLRRKKVMDNIQFIKRLHWRLILESDELGRLDGDRPGVEKEYAEYIIAKILSNPKDYPGIIKKEGPAGSARYILGYQDSQAPPAEDEMQSPILSATRRALTIWTLGLWKNPSDFWVGLFASVYEVFKVFRPRKFLEDHNNRSAWAMKWRAGGISFIWAAMLTRLYQDITTIDYAQLAGSDGSAIIAFIIAKILVIILYGVLAHAAYNIFAYIFDKPMLIVSKAPDIIGTDLFRNLNKAGSAVLKGHIAEAREYLDWINNALEGFNYESLPREFRGALVKMLGDSRYIMAYNVRVRLLLALEKTVYIENTAAIADKRSRFFRKARAMRDDKEKRERYFIRHRYAAAVVMARLNRLWEDNLQSAQPRSFDIIADEMMAMVWQDKRLELTREQQIKFYLALMNLKTDYLVINRYTGGLHTLEGRDPYRLLENITGVRLNSGIRTIRYDPRAPFAVYFEFTDKDTYVRFRKKLWSGGNLDLSAAVYFREYAIACGYSQNGSDPFNHEIQHAFFRAIAMPLSTQVGQETELKDLKCLAERFSQCINNDKDEDAMRVIDVVIGKFIEKLKNEFLACYIEAEKVSYESNFNFYVDYYGKEVGMDKGVITRFREVLATSSMAPERRAKLIRYLLEAIERARQAVIDCERITDEIIEIEGWERGFALLHTLSLDQYSRLVSLYTPQMVDDLYRRYLRMAGRIRESAVRAKNVKARLGLAERQLEESPGQGIYSDFVSLEQEDVKVSRDEPRFKAKAYRLRRKLLAMASLILSNVGEEERNKGHLLCEQVLRELEPAQVAPDIGGWKRPNLSGIRRAQIRPEKLADVTAEETLDYLRGVASAYCFKKKIKFDPQNIILGEITRKDIKAAGIKCKKDEERFYKTVIVFTDVKDGNKVKVKFDPLFAGRIMAYRTKCGNKTLYLGELEKSGDEPGRVTSYINLADSLVFRTIVHEIGKHAARGKNDTHVADMARNEKFMDEEFAEGVSSQYAPYNLGARLFDRIFSEEGITGKEDFKKALARYLDANTRLRYWKENRGAIEKAAIAWYEHWESVNRGAGWLPRLYCEISGIDVTEKPKAGKAAFDTGQNEAEGPEIPVEEVILDISGKSQDDITEALFELLTGSAGSRKIFIRLEPKSIQEDSLCRGLGFDNASSNTEIIKELTPDLRRENIKIELSDPVKDSAPLGFYKVTLASGRAYTFVPADEDTLGQLRHIFKGKEPIASRLYHLATEGARFRICGMPLVLRDEAAKVALLEQLPLTGAETGACRAKLVSSQEKSLMEKRKEEKPAAAPPPILKTTGGPARLAAEGSATRHEEKAAPPAPRRIEEKRGPEKVVSETDYRRRLEACLRPFFRGGFSFDKAQSKDGLSAGFRLKQLLTSNDAYRRIREYAAREHNRKFEESVGVRLDPETLLYNVDTPIKRGSRYIVEGKVCGELAIIVRRFMLNWNGLEPPPGFGPQTPLEDIDIYGGLMHGEKEMERDNDFRAYFDYGLDDLLENIEFLAQLALTSYYVIGFDSGTRPGETCLFTASHWGTRKMGLKPYYRPVDIARKLVSCDILDIQVIRSPDPHVTPPGIAVTLAKKYRDGLDEVLMNWRFFLLKTPFKDASEETDDALDDIEAFKAHFEYDAAKIEELAFKSGDYGGNIKRAENLIRLASRGLMLSPDYCIADEKSKARNLHHLKARDKTGIFTEFVTAEVERQIDEAISEEAARRAKLPAQERAEAMLEEELAAWLHKKRVADVCIGREPDDTRSDRVNQLVVATQQTGVPDMLAPCLKALFLTKEGKESGGKPRFLFDDSDFKAVSSAIKNSAGSIKQFCAQAGVYSGLIPDADDRRRFLTACSLELPYVLNFKDRALPVRLREAMVNLSPDRDFSINTLNVISPAKVKGLFSRCAERQNLSGQEKRTVREAVARTLGVEGNSLTPALIEMNADRAFTGLCAGLNKVVELRKKQPAAASDGLEQEIILEIDAFGLPEEARGKLAAYGMAGEFSTEGINLRLCQVWARCCYPSLFFYPEDMLGIVGRAHQKGWSPEAVNEHLKAEEARKTESLAQLRNAGENLVLARTYLPDARRAIQEGRLGDAKEQIADIKGLGVQDARFLADLKEVEKALAKAAFEVSLEQCRTILLEKGIPEALAYLDQLKPLDGEAEAGVRKVRGEITAKAKEIITEGLLNIEAQLNNDCLTAEGWNLFKKKLEELAAYKKYGIVDAEQTARIGAMEKALAQRKYVGIIAGRVSPLIERLTTLGEEELTLIREDIATIESLEPGLREVVCKKYPFISPEAIMGLIVHREADLRREERERRRKGVSVPSEKPRRPAPVAQAKPLEAPAGPVTDLEKEFQAVQKQLLPLLAKSKPIPPELQTRFEKLSKKIAEQKAKGGFGPRAGFMVPTVSLPSENSWPFSALGMREPRSRAMREGRRDTVARIIGSRGNFRLPNYGGMPIGNAGASSVNTYEDAKQAIERICALGWELVRPAVKLETDTKCRVIPINVDTLPEVSEKNREIVKTLLEILAYQQLLINRKCKAKDKIRFEFVRVAENGAIETVTSHAICDLYNETDVVRQHEDLKIRAPGSGYERAFVITDQKHIPRNERFISLDGKIKIKDESDLYMWSAILDIAVAQTMLLGCAAETRSNYCGQLSNLYSMLLGGRAVADSDIEALIKDDISDSIIAAQKLIIPSSGPVNLEKARSLYDRMLAIRIAA